MQGIKQLLHTVEKFTTDNSPALLTAVGVVGTLSTAVLSARAHVQATDILREDRRENQQPSTRKDVFKRHTQLTWKVYIPPVSVAALTCTSIICANRIGTRRAAAMATAYAVTDKAFTEYKEKIVEQLGETKEQKVRDEIAQDRVRNNPPSSAILLDEDETLFYDKFTGRYFKSTMETVKAAQNHVNYILNKEGDVSLNTFYSWLSLDTVTMGEELGWRFDKGEVELLFSSTIADNNKPAIVIEFKLVPIRNYDSAYG